MSYVEILNVTFLLIISISIFGWIFSLIIKDSSIADILWGLYFLAGAIFIFIIRDINPSIIQIIVLVAIIIWSLRLSLHIGIRKVGKEEDYRYKDWRKKWGSNFLIYSLIQNFIFQGILAFMILSSVMVIDYNQSIQSLGWWQIIGIAIWLFGFIYEIVSDYQLNNFKKTKKSKEEVLKTGLWKYSRHPNYFGEISQWWGIWIISIGFSYFYIGLLSPILITFLIVKVSGVPLLEKRYKNNLSYQKYAIVTPSLLPIKIRKRT